MKRFPRKVIVVVGVFLAAGVVGAAAELLMDAFFHFTEPLSGWAWAWSFFHRFKFYAAFSAASGGFFAAAWFGLTKLIRLWKKSWRPSSPARMAYAAAFAAAVGGAPLWFYLANWDVQLEAHDGLRVFLWWFVPVVIILVHELRVARVSARFNRVVTRALAVTGYAAAGGYLALGLVGLAARPRAAPGLPDVVVITLDSCRADEVGRRPDGSTLTPNIDRFAAGAYVFTQCRAQASWTSPSLATLMTGQYPMVHLATAERPLGTSQPTLATVLRAAGYDTKAVVANRLCHRESGLARGFDSYQYWDQSPVVAWSGYYETYYFFLADLLYGKRNTYEWERQNHTTVITDRAVRILKAGRRRPLFLWCHYLDPHTPYDPPPEFVAPADRPWVDKVKHGDQTNGPLLRRLYDGEVRYIDRELARVFPLLAGNAVVVITSDHGEEFFEHGHYDHGRDLYEESIRVPMVVRLPGGGRGETQAPVGLVDVAPTLLSVVGLPVPDTMQGRDFSRAPAAAEWDYPTYAGSSMLTGDRRYCVVYRNHKFYLRHNQSMSEGAYYDLTADPHELKPLVTFAPDRRECEDLLKAWLEGNIAFSDRFRSAEVSRAVNDHLRAMGYIE